MLALLWLADKIDEQLERYRAAVWPSPVFIVMVRHPGGSCGLLESVPGRRRPGHLRLECIGGAPVADVKPVLTKPPGGSTKQRRASGEEVPPWPP